MRADDQPSYLLGEVLDAATELCEASGDNPQFRRGVAAMVAALAMPEIEDTDRAGWIAGLAVDKWL